MKASNTTHPPFARPDSSGHTCTTDTTDFRGGVWGFTRAAATPTSGTVIVTVGPALQIRFKDEDLSILETHPLTPGLVLAAVTTGTVSSEASPVSTTLTGFSTITRQATTTTAGETTLSQSSSVDTSKGEATSDIEPGTLVITTTEISTAMPTSSSSQSSINPGSLAAIILSSILAVVVMAIGSVIILRRNRRSQQNKSARSLRLHRVLWQSRDAGPGAGRRSSVASVASIGLPMQNTELPGSAPIIPELALSTPFGAKENPAELNGRGLAAELTGGPVAPSTTWSWMSRASGKWSTRSWKTRSSVARSSFRWTRSAASVQTASSGHYSGDWDSFARGKWGDADGLGVPAVPTDRPLPEVPKTPKTPGSARPHIASHLKPELDLNKLRRISDGTFGAPGRSPLSPRFNRT
ncbi:hypothetical protein TruAng_010961 [Truncatella angustata]|nr:hypothetical protein TruAng_010961 [Truncatella angustata]